MGVDITEVDSARMKVSFEEDDLDDDHVVNMVSGPNVIEVAAKTDSLTKIPAPGQWCVASLDGDIVAKGDIGQVEVVNDVVAVTVPKVDH